ncbi:hypothetical protein REPUB_Repub03eG0205300 [Reevesia pubescens]
MLCFHYGNFGHLDLECEVRKKMDEGYSEQQALSKVALEKIPNREFENEQFGPWMIARKNNRSRYSVLDNGDELNDEIEVVPNTFETRKDVGTSIGVSKKILVRDKEDLKKCLQDSVEISNKGGVKRGDKELEMRNMVVKVVSSKKVVKGIRKNNRKIGGTLKDVSNIC